MRTGLTISCAGHAAILVVSVLTFVARPYQVESGQALPIDIVSASEFAQMTGGAKSAPPVEKPKPVAEKIDEPTPVEDLSAKLAKREIKATTDVPPAPEPKPPEPKPKAPASSPQPPVDQIAGVLKKDEEKKPEPKKPVPKPPTPPKKQVEDSPPVDLRRLVAPLLNKQDSQRVASATDRELNRTPSRTDLTGGGGPTSGANNPNGLSDIEKSELKAKLKYYWDPPPTLRENQGISIEVQFHLNPDGTLDGAPQVLTQGEGPLFMAASESAKRAIRQAQPYSMFRPEHYDAWRNLEVTFDPKTMGY